MKLLLIGPPMVGKGTQAKLLSDYLSRHLKLKIPHISSGDMLRDMADRRHPLGLEAKAIIDGGNLFPDEKMNPLVRERLKYKDCINGFLLDGYPRNVAQAMEFDKEHTLNMAIYLDVPPAYHDALKQRMFSRRECKLCSISYGLENAPAVSEICDQCGHALFKRADDGNPEIFDKRQKEYREQTSKLVPYYSRKLVMVNAKRSKQEVFEDIVMQMNMTLPSSF